MTNITKKSIVSMNFGEKVRLSHQIAQNLEGDYSVRLILAWEYITGKRKNSIKKINNLVTSASKKVSTEKVEKAPTKKAAKKQQAAKKKAAKTVSNKTFKQRMETRIKQGKPAIVALDQDTEKDLHDNYDWITSTDIRPNLSNEILETGLVSEKVINTIIERRVKIGMKENVFFEGILEIEQATTVEALRRATMLYFSDKDIIKKAYKYIQLGLNYKKVDDVKTEKELHDENNYNHISPNGSRLQVETIDTLKDVQEKIKEGFKDTKLFSNMGNYHTAITFLVSNALRKEIRRKFNGNVSISNFNDMVKNDEIGDGEKMDYITQGKKKVETVSSNTVHLFNLVDTLTLSNYEKEIFKIRLLGYSDKNIDVITGKRNDRTYKKMDSYFMEKLGITDKKEFRKLYKSTVRNLTDIELPSYDSLQAMIKDVELSNLESLMIS